MTPRERIRVATDERLREMLEFYDTDKLRAHYSAIIAEVKAEQARRAARSGS